MQAPRSRAAPARQRGRHAARHAHENGFPRKWKFLACVRATFLGVLAGMVSLPAAEAKIEWPSTCQSIKDAELIVRGRIMSVQSDVLEIGGTAATVPAAILQITEIIKGASGALQIRVLAGPLTLESRVRLDPGTEYVLMLGPYTAHDGKRHPDLYVPSHQGYGSSIATPGPPDAGRAEHPLRVYYCRDAQRAWVTREFPDVPSYVQEIRRILAAEAAPGAPSLQCE